MRIGCREYVDALMYCLTPASQFSSYYRVATVDDCRAPYNRLKLCMKVSLATTGDEERVRLAEELRDSPGVSSRSVWTSRLDPRASWAAAARPAGSSPTSHDG